MMQRPRECSSPYQGDPKAANQDSNGHVGEPAPPRRMNDRGGIYTKVRHLSHSTTLLPQMLNRAQNSDYKDSFRRD